MVTASMSASTRSSAIDAMSGGVDVLVIGGGVTGAGVALDAATRGLRTAIVEAEDWASGTSSVSTKLVHGGLRYLYQLNFRLVAESLRERGLLLTKIAPHLVTPLPFLWPLKGRVVERAYSAVGIAAYDALALLGARGRTMPLQKHFSKSATLKQFPSLRDNILAGSIRFFDAKVDDARLVITLVRTAVSQGALAASRTRVVGLRRDAQGRVVGAEAIDNETGDGFFIPAKHVVSAAGVWTEEIESLTPTRDRAKVLASKGVHLLFPRSAIDGETGIALRTERSILGIIPWDRYWIVGTTDTAWHEERRYPVPNKRDIKYLLEQANSVLKRPLQGDDILGTYAGLRPLVLPQGESSDTTKISRDHLVREVAPGLTVVVGGKLTTYRQMAEDTIDAVLGSKARTRHSITKDLPLAGAEALTATRRNTDQICDRYGLAAEQVQHLLGRYGSDIRALLCLVDEDASMKQPLVSAPAYLRAEVVFGVLYEGALHLEDVLIRRIRLNYETRDRGASAVDEVAQLMAPLLGWDQERLAGEKASYLNRARAERAAEEEDDDSAAIRVRLASSANAGH